MAGQSVPQLLQALLGVGALTACAACTPPARVALPSPFPLTYGGTSIPANGAVFGLELGDALRGQEVKRDEVGALTFGVGLRDRASVSLSAYGGNQSYDPTGQIWRVTTRIGRLFGPRSSASVHLAYATMQRTLAPTQDDRLRTVDVAVPVEMLLGAPSQRRQVGAYFGPRVTRESISDRVEPGESLRHVYPGLLGGVHLRYRFVHLFGEATLLYVPKSTFHNVRYGGGLTVIPAAGFLLRIGREHAWTN